jgi:hypothetical protein
MSNLSQTLANQKKTSSRGKKKPRLMTQETIPFSDVQSKRVHLFKKKDFEEELKKIYDRIVGTLPQLEKMGNYGLEEIEISVGVSGGILVLTVQGGITLRYNRSETTQP